MSLADVSLGAQIRRLRGDLFSQRELATVAGVSVDTIRKLEQGVRHTASIATLHRIARALDVDLGMLFGERSRFPTGDPQHGVVAIRRALTPVDDLLDEFAWDTEHVGLDESRRVIVYAWGLYRSGRFERLVALLPNALTQLRCAVRAARADEEVAAYELLAQLYWVTARTLICIGHPDAAWLAIKEALLACAQGDDVLLDAMLRGTVAWQLVRQGRYAESVRVARHAASNVEPVAKARSPDLSVFGYLLAEAAVAAGRDDRVAEARDLLAESRATASRIGADRNDYETAFGPSLAVSRTVSVEVTTGNFADALDAARAMPGVAGLPVVSRARHLADLAFAHTRLGDFQRGKQALFTMAALAPEWIRHHELPRQTAAELLRRDRDQALRDLARRLGFADR